MRKIIGISLLLFFAVDGLGQSADSISVLDDYLVTAAENNPQLKSSFQSYLIALEKVGTVGNLPDPNIAFGVFILPVETRLGPQRLKVGFTQMFPWFGVLPAEREAAAAKAQIEFEKFEQVKSQLYLDIRLAYFELYFLDRSLAIIDDNLELLYLLNEIAITKYEAATVSLADKLRIDLEVNELENKKHDLLDLRHFYISKFNYLLNRDSSEAVTVVDTLVNPVITIQSTSLDSIFSNNHQLGMLNNKLNALMKSEDLAEKRGTPKIAVGLDYILIGESSSPMVDPAVNGRDALMLPRIGITLPIYRKKYKAMVKVTQLEQEKANLDLKATQNSLATLHEKVHLDFSKAERKFGLYKEQKEIANQILDLLITQYSTDGKNFEEVLRIERKLLAYQLQLERSISDLNAAWAFSEFLQGK